jgi:DNA-binding MarR family transcriptional regulator
VSRSEREANVVGAFALAVTDMTSGRAAETAGQSVSAAAALSALRQYLQPVTLDRLREVLGLTHSGAVRLVDRLVAAGLATRERGTDGRSRIVSLTTRGGRTADRVRAGRLESLGEILAPLSAADRRALKAILDRLMAGIVEHKNGGAWLCRLCDIQACGRASGTCPTANAALVKYGEPG